MSDAWLSRYHHGRIDVWCSSSSCELHRDGISVEYESENGIVSLSPEECPVCHSAWLEDQPLEEE